MKRIALAILLSAFAMGSALADDTCQTKAVGKDGKPLAGAALSQLPEEVQGGCMRAQGSRCRWKATRRCRQGQLPQEVRERCIGDD